VVLGGPEVLWVVKWVVLVGLRTRFEAVLGTPESPQVDVLVV